MGGGRHLHKTLIGAGLRGSAQGLKLSRVTNDFTGRALSPDFFRLDPLPRNERGIFMDACPTKPAPLRAVGETVVRPSRQEAEAAVRTLLAWTGDDPAREGLRETPARVVRAFEEWFAGYDGDAAAILSRTFEEVSGYDDMVMLRNIEVQSHCEHHMAPFIGLAHVAYLPRGRVVGLSKIARLVEVFARRLQTQENLTAQIASALMDELEPLGCAVMVVAEHQCMSTRGVHHDGVDTVTTRFAGAFADDDSLRERFLRLAEKR